MGKIYGRLFLPDWFNSSEKILRLPIIFTLIYIYGGLFANQAVSYVPNRLTKLFETQPLFRLIGLLALGYTATGEVEYAIVSTAIILIIMHLLRTPEEREKLPLGF